MRKLLIALLVAATVGCTQTQDEVSYVRIVPSIRTRVSGLYFEAGDRIGLRIVKGSEEYVPNCMMTYDGAAFTAEGLLWYDNLHETSTLMAYHPYSEAGMPAEFTVAADQRGGCTSSDLLAAVKEDVTPASAPVGMVFYHVMSQLSILLTNNSNAQVTGVVIDGFAPTAEVDYTIPSARAKSGVAAASVEAFCVTAATYRAILAPQQAPLTVRVFTSDGKSHSKTLSQATLESGKRYDLSVTLTDIDITLTFSGEIGDWVDGGELGGGDHEQLQEVIYEGVSYPTTKLGGRVWMAANLRYMPQGVVLGKGVWNPYDGEPAIPTQGLLYNYATATGGAAGSTQGICPPGWHIPDAEELAALVADPACDISFFCCAGSWVVGGMDDGYGSGTKGYLMGAMTSETKCACVSYVTTSGAVTAGTVSRAYGISLRCVRNVK